MIILVYDYVSMQKILVKGEDTFQKSNPTASVLLKNCLPP